MGASRNGHWIWISCIVCFALLEAVFGGDKPRAAAAKMPPPQTVSVTAPRSEPAPVAALRFYTVQANDGWQRIAHVNHVEEQALLDANGATEQTVIIPGQAVIIPTQTVPVDSLNRVDRSPSQARQNDGSSGKQHANETSSHAARSGLSPSPTNGSSPQQTYVPPSYGATGYGEISNTTGLPRTQYVSGYTRKDGTYVAPYYRRHR